MDDLAPGSSALFDGTALGHPVRSLSDIRTGDYHAQAYLHVYTTFERADGHTVKLPMDQGEGQKWRRSPGNLFSEPSVIRIEAGSDKRIELVLDQVIPPIEPKEDAEWIKCVRIESKLLSAFWGQPKFAYGPRGGHGRSPFEGNELLEALSRHMELGSTDG